MFTFRYMVFIKGFYNTKQKQSSQLLPSAACLYGNGNREMHHFTLLYSLYKLFKYKLKIH